MVTKQQLFMIMQHCVTLPSLLTLTRLFFIPFIMHAMITHCWMRATILFALASLTDALDGWCARALNCVTLIGAWLDHSVDKLFILACLTTFACARAQYPMPHWFMLILVIKELLLISAVITMLWQQGRCKMAPTFFGKAAMMMQMIIVIFYLTSNALGIVNIVAQNLLLATATFIILASLFQYAWKSAYWCALQQDHS